MIQRSGWLPLLLGMPLSQRDFPLIIEDTSFTQAVKVDNDFVNSPTRRGRGYHSTRPSLTTFKKVTARDILYLVKVAKV